MPHFEQQIRIRARKDVVWRALADLGEVQQFHPFVKKSYYVSDHKSGIGASRHCDLKPGGRVEEEVTDWQDGDSLTLTISRGEKMPPFKVNRFRQTLREENGETVLRMEVDYEIKYGLLGRVLDKLIFRYQLSGRLIPVYLKGLKRFVEVRSQPAAQSA